MEQIAMAKAKFPEILSVLLPLLSFPACIFLSLYRNRSR